MNPTTVLSGGPDRQDGRVALGYQAVVAGRLASFRVVKRRGARTARRAKNGSPKVTAPGAAPVQQPAPVAATPVAPSPNTGTVESSVPSVTHECPPDDGLFLNNPPDLGAPAPQAPLPPLPEECLFDSELDMYSQPDDGTLASQFLLPPLPEQCLFSGGLNPYSQPDEAFVPQFLPTPPPEPVDDNWQSLVNWDAVFDPSPLSPPEIPIIPPLTRLYGDLFEPAMDDDFQPWIATLDAAMMQSEDLSWGVRWIILRILNDENRFAKVVVLVLRLSRPQVREFLEIYLREECAWRTWEKTVFKIPYSDLLEFALEKRISVARLLHYYRPSLLTDHVSRVEEERGVLFLQERRMNSLVDLFRSFCIEPFKDFLPLQIEWELYQDGIDKQLIQHAFELGWIRPGALAIRQPAAEVPSEASPLRSGGGYAPFLGTICQRVPLPLIEGGHDRDYDSNEDDDLNAYYDSDETQDEEHTTSPDKADAAQPNDKHSMPSNTDHLSTNDSSTVIPTANPLPALPFMPEPLEFQPWRGQEALLQQAWSRTHPMVFKYASGSMVSTLVEEGRDLVPYKQACWPQGPYVQLGPRVLQGYVNNMYHGARSRVQATNTQTRGRHLPSSNGNGQSTTTNERTTVNEPAHQSQTTAAHHAINSHQEDPRQVRQSSAEDTFNPVRFMTPAMDTFASEYQPSEDGSFHDEQDSDFELFEIPTDSTLPEYRLAMLGGFQNTTHSTTLNPSELTPSDQLRHRLDTDFSSYLKKRSAPVRRNTTNRNRNRSRKKQTSEEALMEDLEEGYDIVLPEAEKDTAYCPKRSNQQKRPRKATGGGRKKKAAVVSDINEGEEENNETTATAEGNGYEGPKDGHSALEANKESDSGITEAQGIANRETSAQKEPINNPTNNGPASSGRIKIVLKSSHSATPASPNSETENLTRGNSPIFGIERHSIMAGTRERVQRAHYAWSAEEATFASISTHAHFAQTADRIVKPPSMGKTVSIDMAAELGELQRLQTAFDNIEGAQKGQGAQDAERAEFAGCADRATYAVQAEAACFAVEVKGVDKDGDCEMIDAE
ncbi:hypothetical protein ACHAPT_010678 [Fusarium lateritium]